MKKTLCIITMLLFVATLVPIADVFAAPSADDAPADSLWHCVENTGADGCDMADDNPLPIDGVSSAGVTITKAQIICMEEGCNTEIPVYISVSFSATWSSSFERDITIVIQAYGGDGMQTATVDCGSGTEGECGTTLFFVVMSSSSNPEALFHAMTTLAFGWAGVGDVVEITYTVTYSGEPKDCDSEYKIEECVSLGTAIPATSETGVSADIETGKQYRLKLTGEWQAEPAGPDLTDVEISFDDGVTWMSPMEMMEQDLIDCVKQDPESPDLIIYFTAPTDKFKIRVKDTPGQYANNTGGMTMDLCEASVAGEQETCAGQFTVGATVVASGSFAATEDHHIVMAENNYDWQEFVPGQWYVLTTSGGPWQDGAVPPDRYDIQMSSTTSNGVTPSNWQTPDDYSMSNCMSEGGNYISVYFQGSVSRKLWLRVNDDGGVFIDNSGDMHYTITQVDEYEPYAQGCSLPFDIGNFIEERVISVSNRSGVELMETSNFQFPYWPFGGQEFPEMSRYLVLETFGSWTHSDAIIGQGLNDNINVEGDIKKDNADWSIIPEWPEAYCVQEIDPIGHVRVFFDASDIETARWKFRAHDDYGNILQNFGTYGYRLYYGINLQVPQDPGELPETGFCDPAYSHDPDGVTITLYGNAEAGIVLPLIAPEVVVGIEVVGGPWQNNGVDSYATAISDDNGASYVELTNYPGAVCKEQGDDADHPFVYVLGKTGKEYRVRVHDPGFGGNLGDFDDNSGSIQMIVYPVTVNDIVDPWNSCSNNYNVTEVPLTDDQRTVGGSLITGKKVDSITPGTKYALEITGEGLGWMSNIITGEMSFKAEVTDGDEFAWFPEATWIECAVEITAHEVEKMARYRIYFTAAAAKEYRIKAATTLPAAGWIRYRLYKTTDSDIALPPDIFIPPGDQQQWGGCNMTCYRPEGLFTITPVAIGSIATISLPVPDVGGWVDYVRCATFVYLSWCQEHTNMLISMVANMQTREPFGMISEVGDAYQTVKDDVEGVATGGDGEYDFSPQSYVFQGGDTGGQGSGFPGLFPKLEQDSPWVTGQFDFTTAMENPGTGGDATQKAAYINYCQSVFISRLGLSAWGFCAILGLTRYSIGDTFWIMIQFAADVSLVIGFIFYIKRSWIDTGAAG